MSIQPVQVAKSRRGRFGAFLALAAMVAALGAWWTSASALPNTTITWQGPVANATVTIPYQTVEYAATATLTGGSSTGATTFRLTLPAGAVNITPDTVTPGLTCPAFTAGSTTSATNIDCTGANLAAGAYQVVLDVQLVGDVATFAAPTATISDTVNSVDPVTGNAVTNGADLVAVPANVTNALGVPEVFVFTLEESTTCQSDTDDSDTDTDVDCSAADVVLTGGLVLESIVVTDPDLSDPSTVTVTVSGNTTGTVALLLRGNVPTEVEGPPPVDFTSAAVTKTYAPAELRHMADPVCTTEESGGSLVTTCAPAEVVVGGADFANVIDPPQDVPNNVRGSRHTVCTVAANTGIVGVPAVPVQIPLTLPNTQITFDNGGGYVAPAWAAAGNPLLSVGAQTPTVTDVTVFTGSADPVNGGLDGATCFSWVSVAAGDQQLNVTYEGADGASHNVNWDVDGDNNDNDQVTNDGPVNRALIKEWNVLEQSQIGGTTADALGAYPQTVNLTRALVIDPFTGLFRLAPSTSFSVTDAFLGSHVTRAGSVFTGALAGVNWTVGLNSGSCGQLFVPFATGVNFTATGNVDVDEDGVTIFPGGSIAGTTTLTSTGAVGNNPAVSFSAGDTIGSNCTVSNSATITFTGSEPGPLASGVGRTVTETVTITFTQQVAAKQVLLAWAGQRIILDHDWRILEGDEIDGDPVGVCPFPSETSFGGIFDNVDQAEALIPGFIIGTEIQYVKGSGPGNFLQGLGAYKVTDSTAYVRLLDEEQSLGNDQYGDIPNYPQGSCISRVLYESEDPGEVDIEAQMTGFYTDLGGFIPAVNTTKVAFVVYYMKINRVDVSLVTQVSKPGHNSSSGAPTGINGVSWTGISGVLGNDYSPGNPWDASQDAADNTADWNVSRDLLVRGRVTGWFVNANPSGRERDASDPLNVLPADRWVMPDDWALLAGGPADPANGSDATGTAEQFRPYYDLMFAPNNTRGISLSSPEGTGTQTSPLTVIAPPAGSRLSQGAVGVTPIVADGPFTENTATTFAIRNTTGLTFSQIITPSGEIRTVTSIRWLLNPVGSIIGAVVTVQGPLSAVPAAGASVSALFSGSPVPFEGPYSLIDIVVGGGNLPTLGSLAASNGGVAGAAPTNCTAPIGYAGCEPGGTESYTRDTALGDGDVDMWDAPMPPAMVSVQIRGTGFIKQVIKSDVYYNGTPNTAALADGGTQTYPNPYYISNIPADPFIPANVVGGGYLWDSWANDGPPNEWSSAGDGTQGAGPYRFWTPVRIGVNSEGVGETMTAAQSAALAATRTAYNDPTIARDLVVYSDNHGEFMVTANGDFRVDLTGCAANVLGGGRHCKPGDEVGTGTIHATADYPDFRGKHFPVASNNATVTWTWGGYKDVTVEAGEDPQFKYVVFHAMDRDAACNVDPLGLGRVSLHPVLTGAPNDTFTSDVTGLPLPSETIDFLIDSGEGIILQTSRGASVTNPGTNDGRQFATGVPTYSTALNEPSFTGIREFPLSPLAAADQTDECQAWIKVSNSLLGILNVLVIANDDEGRIGFDRVIDLQNTATFTLNFRWSLITWTGADNIPVEDALAGTGANEAGNDISDQVTAVYGWDAAAQDWLGYFPTGVDVPGANDLVTLEEGQAYWIAIKGPSSVTWTIATNVGS